MADKVEIRVSISPEGNVTVSTHGLKGASCTAETEALEKAVGKVVKREKTPEAYEKESAGVGLKGKLR